MYTLTEAAGALGVTPDTLRQQIRNGKLEATKVGPVWTVSAAEVERYSNDHLMNPHLASVEGLVPEVDPTISDEVAALRSELFSVLQAWHRDAHEGSQSTCDLCRPGLALLR